MKKTKLRMLAIAVVAIATVGVTKAQVTGVTSPTTCVPPLGGEYAAQFHAHYTNGANVWDLTNPIHDRFTQCDPVPPAGSGGSSTHTFGSGVKATVTTNGVAMQIDAPAQVTVHVQDAGPNATGGELYQTEMLQLNISGGSLPAGTMIRESPTLQSTGQTTVKPVAGGFQIDSFFDIFTELSVDGGATWMPSTTGPGHVVLRTPGSNIPTMGQWGLIIFSTLMVAFGVTMLNRRKVVAA